MTSACAAALTARTGVELEAADDAPDFAAKVLACMDPSAATRMGRRARARILADYAWSSRLALLDDLLERADRCVSHRLRRRRCGVWSLLRRASAMNTQTQRTMTLPAAARSRGRQRSPAGGSRCRSLSPRSSSCWRSIGDGGVDRRDLVALGNLRARLSDRPDRASC